MSTTTIALINQITHNIATNNEASHRIIQWIDNQSKYNSKNNKDIRGLDVALEGVENKVKNIQEDLERKRKDIEQGKEEQAITNDTIAKLVAAVAVLEGQVDQQRQLIDHQQILIDHAQTIATQAIKRARLSPPDTDSTLLNSEAGPSRVTPRTTPSRTLGYPLARSRARRPTPLPSRTDRRSPSIELVSRPSSPDAIPVAVSPVYRPDITPRVSCTPAAVLRALSPSCITDLIN